MQTQQRLRFKAQPTAKGTAASIRFQLQRLNNPKDNPCPTPSAKLFADLLKRQARSVMGSVTECDALQLPAHLARLDDLRAVIRHAMQHELVADSEGARSGAQLTNAHTLADYLECLNLTRQGHRAPSFVCQRDADIAQINHKLDLLSGLFAQSPALQAVMDEEGGGL